MGDAVEAWWRQPGFLELGFNFVFPGAALRCQLDRTINSFHHLWRLFTLHWVSFLKSLPGPTM